MKSKLTLIRIAPVAMLAFPMLALALAPPTVSQLDVLFVTLSIWLPRLVALIISFAVVVFIWGVFKFVSAAGDEEKRKEGKQFIIWGIIGIAVMVLVWGLVQLLYNVVATSTGGLDTAVLPAPGIPAI